MSHPTPEATHSTSLKLFLATAGFAAAGVFVKLIGGSVLAIIFGRALFAALFLILVLGARRQLQWRVGRTEAWPIFLVGLFNAGNWGFYFAAISVSTVAVAVVSLFTYPFMTAILEPLMYHEEHNPIELVAGLAVVVGVVFVVPEFTLGNRETLGVALGLISALSFTLRNLVGRKLLRTVPTTTSLIWQLLIGVAIFLPFAPAGLSTWTAREWTLLACLGVFFTAIPHALFFDSLRHVTSRHASLLTSMQPVFSVMVAFFVLGERPGPRTLIGGGLILASVMLVASRRRRAA